MSAHVPGFQSFLVFLHHSVLAKLATSTIGVKNIDSVLRGVRFQKKLWYSKLKMFFEGCAFSIKNTVLQTQCVLVSVHFQKRVWYSNLKMF